MLFGRTVLHCWLHENRNLRFKVSRLRYATEKHTQYQTTVKLLGSFRLTAGNRHLHRYCIFTELFPETVSQSFRHSCASELTRQGTSLTFVTITFLWRQEYFYLALIVANEVGLYLLQSYWSLAYSLWGFLDLKSGSFLLIVRTKRFLLLPVLLDTRSFQHMARCLWRTFHICEIGSFFTVPFYFWLYYNNPSPFAIKNLMAKP